MKIFHVTVQISFPPKTFRAQSTWPGSLTGDGFWSLHTHVNPQYVSVQPPFGGIVSSTLMALNPAVWVVALFMDRDPVCVHNLLTVPPVAALVTRHLLRPVSAVHVVLQGFPAPTQHSDAVFTLKPELTPVLLPIMSLYIV